MPGNFLPDIINFQLQEREQKMTGFTGKNAVITGGAHGIGKAIADAQIS